MGVHTHSYVGPTGNVLDFEVDEAGKSQIALESLLRLAGAELIEPEVASVDARFIDYMIANHSNYRPTGAAAGGSRG